MLLERNSKLVMIGDSVTDCERARPVGEGLFGGIGKGYVSIVDGLLNATYPEQKIRVINMGSSGDNVRNLKNRWQSDVLDLKPDWLSIMIGINDVWRQFDTPHITENHVNIDEYRDSLEYLVKSTLPVLKGMILMTPYYIEKNNNDEMRSVVDKYGAVVKEIAIKYNTVTVDTQAAFDEILEHYYPAASPGTEFTRIHLEV
jgi:lysophospholipase L1-like esterase